MNIRVRFGLMAAVIALAGCASTPTSEPTPAPTPEALNALQQVRAAYQANHYKEVIRKVGTPGPLNESTVEVQVEALKLQAFSYCLTNQRSQCEDSFRRILKIQPTFTLSPSESGHPKWDPAFRRAKAELK